MLAFVLILATSCIRVPPAGIWFFNGTTAVFYGRWNGVSMFVTERVIRGDVQVHQTFVFETGPCAHPQRGELYLLSLNCRDGKCGVAWAEEDEAPALLRYLDNRHFETYETVFARALRWQAGKLTDEAFDAWLENVAIKPRGDGDDRFLVALVDELRWLLEVLRPVPARYVRLELESFARLVRRFPRGTAEAFNARVDASDDYEAPYRDEYEDEVIDALKQARQCAEALVQSP